MSTKLFPRFSAPAEPFLVCTRPRPYHPVSYRSRNNWNRFPSVAMPKLRLPRLAPTRFERDTRRNFLCTAYCYPTLAAAVDKETALPSPSLYDMNLNCILRTSYLIQLQIIINSYIHVTDLSPLYQRCPSQTGTCQTTKITPFSLYVNMAASHVLKIDNF
jgi:hypothetical protein